MGSKAEHLEAIFSYLSPTFFDSSQTRLNSVIKVLEINNYFCDITYVLDLFMAKLS